MEHKSSNELYHYGVKGMKWGVRRYQNFDGSYTKRGLARYQKAQDNYDSAKETVRKTKQAYKSGTATKEQYRSARRQMKENKRALDRSYSKLKTDKMADQGKELYKKGKRIRGNLRVNAIAQVGVVLGSRVVNQVLQSSLSDKRVASLAGAAIAVGGTAVNAIIAGKTISENRKLGAYYAH